MGERLPCKQEVRGSTPLGSTMMCWSRFVLDKRCCRRPRQGPEIGAACTKGRRQCFASTVRRVRFRPVPPTSVRKRHVKSNEERRRFYGRVAQILNIEHEYHDPVRRTRWTKRNLGNGRFPGFGLVQCFGSTVRVVSKAGTRMFATYDEVYSYLEKAVDKSE